jgi:hypothetical protein
LIGLYRRGGDTIFLAVRTERSTMVGAIAVAVVAGSGLGGCTKPAPPKKPVAATTPTKHKVKLAVLAVESNKFPKVAAAATQSLAKVELTGWAYGVDEVQVAKVSLEVVQLSIECVEQTPDCYAAAGKTLSANRLLFAQIATEAPVAGISKVKHKHDIKVTVTLFDVDKNAPTKTAMRVFPTEKEATAGIDTLVAEATQR